MAAGKRLTWDPRAEEQGSRPERADASSSGEAEKRRFIVFKTEAKEAAEGEELLPAALGARAPVWTCEGACVRVRAFVHVWKQAET